MTKKKKKPASNPARGFATTSVASKKVIVEATAEDQSKLNEKRIAESNKSSEDVANVKNKEWHELTAEDLEQADLQTFLEAHGAKTTREAQRQIHKLQTDCRVVRPQSFEVNTFRWLPEDILKDINAFAHKEKRQSAVATSAQDLNLDDLTSKSWALLRTLQGLGVSKEVSTDLLKTLSLYDGPTDRSDYIWGLEESLDSLARDHDPHDLPAYDGKGSKIHAILPQENEMSNPPSGTTTPAQQTAGKVDSGSPARLDTVVDDQAKDQAQAAVVTEEFDVSDIDSDADGDVMMQKYLSDKSKLFSIHPDLAPAPLPKKMKAPQRPTISINSPSVKNLQTRIARIEADILFDRDQGLYEWSRLRLDLLKIGVRPKHKSPDSPSTTQSSGDESNVTPKRTTDTTPAALSDDSDDERLMTDMFSEPVANEPVRVVDDITDQSVIHRNFGKITGMTPRRVLEENCRARDSNVRIQLRQISPTTYSCRHSVTISWSKSQGRISEAVPPGLSLHQEISSKDPSKIVHFNLWMTGIATSDVAQSESFVTTAALFILFASSPKEEKVYLKLGPAWRDLWQEFLDFRKSVRDAAQREVIKDIRDVLKKRVQSEEDNGVVLTTALRQRESHTRPNNANRDASTTNDFQYPAWVYAQQMWTQRLHSAPYQMMLQTRMTLPMFGYREAALSIIESSQVTILCGETGCGKSTQLPAYIMENCLASGQECKVLCTEPRRISAISLAHRVSTELGEERNEVGSATSLVGYAVRLETKVGVLTRLIYATVGVVLRMLESSGDLSEYTHLIIDEVHERSIETDFLLVILKGIMSRRPELKVILMSATVDSARFSAYLNDAPVIEVPGRTFPVNTYYLEDAIELTHHGAANAKSKSERNIEEEDDDEEDEAGTSGISTQLVGYSQATRDVLVEYDEYRIDYDLIVALMETIVSKEQFAPFSKAILVFLPGIGEIRELNDMLAGHPSFNCRIYPLHSSISSEEQQAAFETPPFGEMKIVLSTNIAETGVTIPDVTCVIDTGKHKEMRFDEKRQLSRLVQAFISKANAKQRRGRAGRVQEGICFHLFTKKRHDELLAPQQTPEMLRLSLQDLAMRVKIAGLGDIEETLGRALDPPSPKNIRRAIDQLIEVGALTNSEELTPLGRQLAKLPLDPHLGKLCILSLIFGCFDAGLTIAAILSSKSPFLTPFGARQQADVARLAFSRGDSDLLTVYNAYCAWRRVSEKPNENVFAFCRKSFLSPQILGNIEDLKAQIFASMSDTRLIRRDQVTTLRSRGKRGFVKVPLELNENSSSDIIASSVISWAFYPKLLLRDGKGYRSVANSQPISLHPTSVNKGNHKLNYLSYYSIMQSGNKFYHNTNANSTTVAYEVPLMFLAGEADFKIHAGVISIDSNRLKFKVKDWNTAYALKIMRTRMTELVDYRIKHPEHPVAENLAWWKHTFERICGAFGKES